MDTTNQIFKIILKKIPNILSQIIHKITIKTKIKKSKWTSIH